jgi:muscarinic acetylcholine receptor M3
MIFSAWAISAIVWPPSIVAWPYIEGEITVPSNDCYVQVR